MRRCALALESMKNKAIHPAWELLAFILVLVFGILVFWDEPAKRLPEAWERRIDVIGAWFQALGVILLAFEFLRGPLVKRQLENYELEQLERSKEFQDALNAKDNRRKIKQIEAVMQKRADLDERYFSVFRFNMTRRRAYELGLALTLLGYILQLSIK